MILKDCALSAGENEVFLYGANDEKYRISIADAKRMGLDKYIFEPDLLPVQIDDEVLDFLAKKLSCIKYATYLLEFGDKSKKRLLMKLKLKGYDEQICKATIEVLEKGAVLDDERLCRLKLLTLANTKMYGPHRLKSELLEKGFDYDTVHNAIDDAQIDFEEQLRLLVQKITKRGAPKDKKEYMALKNKLLRYGYSYDCISEHLQSMEKEEHEM